MDAGNGRCFYRESAQCITGVTGNTRSPAFTRMARGFRRLLPSPPSLLSTSAAHAQYPQSGHTIHERADVPGETLIPIALQGPAEACPAGTIFSTSALGLGFNLVSTSCPAHTSAPTSTAECPVGRVSGAASKMCSAWPADEFSTSHAHAPWHTFGLAVLSMLAVSAYAGQSGAGVGTHWAGLVVLFALTGWANGWGQTTVNCPAGEHECVIFGSASRTGQTAGASGNNDLRRQIDCAVGASDNDGLHRQIDCAAGASSNNGLGGQISANA